MRSDLYGENSVNEVLKERGTKGGYGFDRWSVCREWYIYREDLNGRERGECLQRF